MLQSLALWTCDLVSLTKDYGEKRAILVLLYQFMHGIFFNSIDSESATLTNDVSLAVCVGVAEYDKC